MCSTPGVLFNFYPVLFPLGCSLVVSSASLRLSLISYHLEVPPSPFYTWAFEDDLGDWTNDLHTWHHKWGVVAIVNETKKAACLLAKAPPAPTLNKKKAPWLLPRANPQEPVDIQARLWSSQIPASLAIQCLVVTYRIDECDSGASLSLLRRDEGYHISSTK